MVVHQGEEVAPPKVQDKPHLDIAVANKRIGKVADALIDGDKNKARIKRRVDKIDAALQDGDLSNDRTVKDIVNALHGLKKTVLDAETGEGKEGLEKAARHIARIEAILQDRGISIIDPIGRRFDDNDAVNVIAYEGDGDNYYISETLSPTIRQTMPDGKVRLIQQAEVVVRRDGSLEEPSASAPQETGADTPPKSAKGAEAAERRGTAGESGNAEEIEYQEFIKKWKREDTPAERASFADRKNATQLRSVVSLAEAIAEGNDIGIGKLRGKHFRLAKTNGTLKEAGLTGEYFTIRAGVVLRHNGKDASHAITAQEWVGIADALTNKKPVLVEKYGEKDGSYRVWTEATINGNVAVVGVDVKNAGKNMEVNSITTAFGAEGMHPKENNVIYPKGAEEMRSVLTRLNSGRYTASPSAETSVAENGGKVKPQTSQTAGAAEDLRTRIDAALNTDKTKGKVLPRTKVVEFGDVPQALRSAGVAEGKIISRADILRKIHTKHALTQEQIAGLMPAMSSPVAVFADGKNFVILTGLQAPATDGRRKPVMVYLKANTKGGKTTFMASAYARDAAKEQAYIDWKNSDRALYFDEKRITTVNLEDATVSQFKPQAGDDAARLAENGGKVKPVSTPFGNYEIPAKWRLDGSDYHVGSELEDFPQDVRELIERQNPEYWRRFAESRGRRFAHSYGGKAEETVTVLGFAAHRHRTGKPGNPVFLDMDYAVMHEITLADGKRFARMELWNELDFRNLLSDAKDYKDSTDEVNNRKKPVFREVEPGKGGSGQNQGIVKEEGNFTDGERAAYLIFKEKEIKEDIDEDRESIAKKTDKFLIELLLATRGRLEGLQKGMRGESLYRDEAVLAGKEQSIREELAKRGIDADAALWAHAVRGAATKPRKAAEAPKGAEERKNTEESKGAEMPGEGEAIDISNGEGKAEAKRETDAAITVEERRRATDAAKTLGVESGDSIKEMEKKIRMLEPLAGRNPAAKRKMEAFQTLVDYRKKTAALKPLEGGSLRRGTDEGIEDSPAKSKGKGKGVQESATGTVETEAAGEGGSALELSSVEESPMLPEKNPTMTGPGLDGADAMTPQKFFAKAQELFPELPMRKARGLVRASSAGHYNTGKQIIRMQKGHDRDMGVLAHELGHHIEHLTRGSVPRPPAALRELAALGKSLYGSKTPAGGYASEGFAEFLRGYVTGSGEIAKVAPKTVEHSPPPLGGRA